MAVATDTTRWSLLLGKKGRKEGSKLFRSLAGGKSAARGPRGKKTTLRGVSGFHLNGAA